MVACLKKQALSSYLLLDKDSVEEEDDIDDLDNCLLSQ